MFFNLRYCSNQNDDCNHTRQPSLQPTPFTTSSRVTGTVASLRMPELQQYSGYNSRGMIEIRTKLYQTFL